MSRKFNCFKVFFRFHFYTIRCVMVRKFVHVVLFYLFLIIFHVILSASTHVDALGYLVGRVFVDDIGI